MNTYKALSFVVVISLLLTLVFNSSPVILSRPDAANFPKPHTSHQKQPGITSPRLMNQKVTASKKEAAQHYLPEEKTVVRVGGAEEFENPDGNFFIIDLQSQPNGTESISLEYDLYGMQDFTCIPHSINDNLATGGIWVRQNNQWTHQSEKIQPTILKQGRNIIRFTKTSGSDYKYMVKNLSLKYDKQNETSRKLVINQPSTSYYYQKFGYLQGFVQGFQSEGAIVKVAGKSVPMLNGMFEKLVLKPEDSPVSWSVNVEAIFPDGEKIASSLTFDKPIDCESFTGGDHEINSSEVISTNEGQFDAHLNGLCLNGGRWTVPQETKIKVIALRDIDFQPMSSGMVNITERGGGYRCLPHGTKFSNDIKISMDYDPSRLPKGYTPSDIFTYYYDEGKRQWIALRRDTVDIANHLVISRTNHFTDFINGIIKVPESPLTNAYTPTSIKDIKAANPLEALDVIEPPAANYMGSANLNYPLEATPGKHGMQPKLALTYTSGGENGWLGLGWNISIPAINVETRWGVPHYDQNLESETYCVNGEQVTTKDKEGFYEKMPHRAPWVLRKQGLVRYYPRVEGAFEKIIRHGTSTKNYWWEVIDRNGSTSYYGKRHDTDSLDYFAILTDDAGNIAYWALTETRDANLNSVKYYYDIVKDIGVTGGNVLGRQIYISRINYTGFAHDEGLYNVIFERYDKTHEFRPDKIINCRYGFKEVTGDLLRRVIFLFKLDTIKKYYFGFEHGEFNKTLLCGMYEADGDEDTQCADESTKFYNPFIACRCGKGDVAKWLKIHSFDYYNDYNYGGSNFQPFSLPVTIAAQNDAEITASNDQSSALNGTNTDSWGAGGALKIGFDPIPFLKTISVGGDYNYNEATSHCVNTMIDINGDGLPDKVFVSGGTLKYRKQYLSSNGSYQFSTPITLSGAPGDILYQESESDAWGMEASFGISGSYQESNSSSTSSIYFADVNGDGLPDIINDDVAYINKLNSIGDPEFSTPSSDTLWVGDSHCEYTLYTGSVNDSVTMLNALDPYFPSQVQTKPFDAVRLWIAPQAGYVTISSPIRLLQDTSLARRKSRHADGVTYRIQHNDTELVHDTIGPKTYTVKSGNISALNHFYVNQGDSIYFRLQSNETRSFDKVIWDPVITYDYQSQTICDANRKHLYRYQPSEDFIIDEDRCIGTPISGSVNIAGTLTMPIISDTVTLKIFHQDSTGSTINTYNYVYTGQSAVSQLISLSNISVSRNDKFYFQLKANTNIDWSAIHFRPHMYYSSVPSPYSIHNDDGSYTFEYYPVVHHTIFNGQKSLSEPHAYSPGSLSIQPQMTFSSMAINSMVVFSVKTFNHIIAKRYIPVINGILGSTTITLSSYGGDTLFFEFFTPDTILAAGAVNWSALVNSNSESVGFHSLLPRSLNKFGALYRGWGQFTYNNFSPSGNKIMGAMLVYPASMSDTSSISSYDTSNIAQFQNAFSNHYNPLNYFFIQMNPDAKYDRYVGFGGLTTISSDSIFNCRLSKNALTLDDPIPAPVISGQQVKTVRKQTETSASSYGFGALGIVNYSHTESTNEVTMDFMDLNGDRYPDIVATDFAQMSNPQGGLSNQRIPHAHETQNKHSNLTSSDASGLTFGTSYENPFKTPGNNDKTSKTSTSGQSNLSGSIGNESDGVEYTWLDINGDGLPDKISSDGKVFLNLGYGFTMGENWDFTDIRKGESENIGLSFGTNFSVCDVSFVGGTGRSYSTNTCKIALQDVNGDGLPDKLVYKSNGDLDVYYNTGSQFLTTAVTFSVKDISSGVSYNKSLNIGASYGFAVTILVLSLKFVTSANYNNGSCFTKENSMFQDMNGDGFPDYVTSTDQANLAVNYSTIGRTNLLKGVNNYLGGKFEMDYRLSESSKEMPQRQWLLSNVRQWDGFPQDGPEYTLNTFSYDSGYYSRYERQNYGFKTVYTNVHNTAITNDPVYKTVVEKYHNGNFVFKGLKYYDVLKDSLGNKFIESTYQWDLKEIATGVVIPPALAQCYGEGFPAISQEDKYFYEGLSNYQIHTQKRYEHGPCGNVIDYYDDGDVTLWDDNLHAHMDYHFDSASKNIISSPSLILINSNNSGYFRHRETSIDYNTGNVKQIRMYNTNDTSVYDLQYDYTGNLTKLTYPANEYGQRMVYNYTYDNDIYTYIAQISDTFGYTYKSTWNYYFGKVQTTHDMADQPMIYNYDRRGRIKMITAPNEIADSIPFTIKIVYWDEYGGRYLRQDSVPWARTLHYDPANPGSYIKTVLFADAKGKVLQTKKDEVMYETYHSDSKKCVVTSLDSVDAFGRTIRSYYPIIEPLGQDSLINFTKDTVPPTLITYDVLDRKTSVTNPDNTITSIAYGFGNDFYSTLRFKTTTIDANGIPAEEYKDHNEKPTSIHLPYNNWTGFVYDALGQLVTSKDPEGNLTSHVYDMFGKRIQRTHPDAGNTFYQYDAAGNLTYLQTQNLANISQSKVHYTYDFNHLTGVQYPDNPENNVKYEYGPPNSGNQAGRILKQEDVNGIQEFTYGRLGEIQNQRKTMIVPFDSIYTFFTRTVYDTWNRIDSIYYPDGEIVKYRYNQAGRLATMDAKKNGSPYNIISHISYDKFGHKVSMTYNIHGATTYYQYDSRRLRLARLLVKGVNNHILTDNIYAYDNTDNILSIHNHATPETTYNIGGASSSAFEYDSLYRLVNAGGYDTVTAGNYDYSLAMTYSPSGNILHKNQSANLNGNSLSDLTVNNYYAYDPGQPHAATSINNDYFRYDYNGNRLIRLNSGSGVNTCYAWDEENRMKLVANPANFGYYLYDAAGERSLKMSGQYTSMNINGNTVINCYVTAQQTLYVNPFLVVNNKEYSKHYYVESQRVLSKIGGGFKYDTVSLFSQVYGFNVQDAADYSAKKQNDETMVNRDLGNCPQSGSLQMTQGLYTSLDKARNADSTENIYYYYNGDHLGSTNFVTNIYGVPTQHMEYLPFGEVLLDENINYSSPYKFNAKELDQESDLYYYGARYYDPLGGIFLGIDPKADKYPSWSAYNYTLDNPIRLIDPDGKGPGGPPLTQINNPPSATTLAAGLTAMKVGVIGLAMVLAPEVGIPWAVADITGGPAIPAPQAWSSTIPSFSNDAPKVNSKPIESVPTATNSPNFIVDGSGQTFPVPEGAVGPSPVLNQSGKQTGVAFTGGKGGTNGQVSTMRIMNSTLPKGKSPGYPNGYVTYDNSMKQGVNPWTGQTAPDCSKHYSILIKED